MKSLGEDNHQLCMSFVKWSFSTRLVLDDPSPQIKERKNFLTNLTAISTQRFLKNRLLFSMPEKKQTSDATLS